MNILFTCAGRRNYLINYFKEVLKNNGSVIAADADGNSPALKDADIGVIVPLITDANYINALTEIIKAYHVDALISLNDLELPLIAKYKETLEKKNVKVLISNEDIISLTFDKYKTFEFLKSIGLNTPKTFCSLPKAIEALNSGVLDFPLVIKPRWGTASIGVEICESIEELEVFYSALQLKLKKNILNNVSQADFDNAILIQKKINGVEYGLDVVNDFDCNYFSAYARKKLKMHAGETDIAESVISGPILEVGKTIGEKLKHVGIMDCDLFLCNETVYVLEMNPRFGGGYPFSHEAGVNVAGMYIEWLKGNKNVNRFDTYKSGVVFSKCSRLMKISKE